MSPRRHFRDEEGADHLKAFAHVDELADGRAAGLGIGLVGEVDGYARITGT